MAIETTTATARYRTVLLFGAPGAGKGTVGKSLGAIPGFLHMACGDVFRDIDLSTPLGKKFIEFSSKGLLVPDDATIALWKVSIDGLVGTHTFRPHRDTLVLDGIPRNVEQAKSIASYVDVRRVFYLVCSDEKLMIDRLQRRALKENRLDDASEEVIRRRWRVYEQETEPVLGFYPASIIERVDAVGAPIKVIHDVLGRILAAPE
ncbi:MAG: nucleoside monophosphate kinase [Armatimonadetes bacterium]|nr:nucleoside monophosphate kinase [Armatimonadota bacterium]